MNERAPRARSVRRLATRGAKVAALTAVLAVGGALFIRAPAVQGLAAPEPAAPRPSGDNAPMAATTIATTMTATTPATATAPTTMTPAQAPVAALAASPRSRQVFDPKDLLLHGPSEPLIPPVIFIDAEIAPRGALTAEPLTPPVVLVDAEIAPRGSMTAEPLVPPVLEDTSSPLRP